MTPPPTADIKAEIQEIWDGKVATAFAGGNGTMTNPYQISNGSHLAYLAQMINAGAATEGLYFVLTQDIVLNDTSDWEQWSDTKAPINNWTAIGRNYINNFGGNLNGQGHTVSGIYIKTDSANQGLFGYVGEKGTVQNMGIAKCYISGWSCVGAMVGENYGTVSNCFNTGTVTGTGYYVGGVIGDNYGTVSNCFNAGTVNGSHFVGGVVGENYGTVINRYNTGSVSGNYYVGGVVGTNWDTVSNCYNTGTVSGNYFVGGVVGDNQIGVVSNSYNTGKASGYVYDGGVVGTNWDTVSNCYNTGTVSGTEHIGGVVGNNSDESSVSNCYNTGMVSGSDYVGGVVGSNNENSRMSNCYYLTGTAKGGINGTDTEGEAHAFTANQFANGEVLAMLKNGCTIGDNNHSGSIWSQDIGTDSAPVLTGVTVRTTADFLNVFADNASQEGFRAYGVTGAIAIEGNAPEVKVVDQDGQTVYTGAEKYIAAAKGIYVVKGNGTMQKVVVK